MNDLVSRLQQALEFADLSWSKASQEIGLSAQAPSKWKKGQISKETLEKVANLTKVDFAWLATGQGQMTNITPNSLQTKIYEMEGRVNGLEVAKPVKLLPIVNEVQAGQFTEIGDNVFDEWEPAHHKDGTYWLRVKGDSMTPNFVQGDLILVGRERVASTGNYVVALVEGDPKATFKKYRECFENGERYHELVALNEFYPPIDSRVKPFEIIGVVLEYKRALV